VNDINGNPLPCDHANERRPLPEISEAIKDVCGQVSALVASLAAGAAIGVRPFPAAFPQWEMQFRFVPGNQGEV
jgi:hypothetical protein